MNWWNASSTQYHKSANLRIFSSYSKSQFLLRDRVEFFTIEIDVLSALSKSEMWRADENSPVRTGRRPFDPWSGRVWISEDALNAVDRMNAQGIGVARTVGSEYLDVKGHR